MLLDAAGVECSTGSACSAGIAQPSHVLLAMGRTRSGRAARCGSPSATPPPSRRRRAGRRAGPGGRAGARRAGLAVGRGVMRVLAACPAEWTRRSPRPGSSTPATTSPASTSPCRATRSPSAPAPAAAAPSRTPATPGGPPTSSASPSTSGTSPSGSPRTSSTTSSTSTPRAVPPTPACAATRRSSSRRSSTRRWPSASTPWAPATTRASSGTGRAAAAPRRRPGEGPVVRARRAHGDQLATRMFPLGDSTKAAVRDEAERRGLAVARKPDSHDICFIPDGDTAGFLRARLGTRRGDVRRRGRRACSARTTAPSPSPSASARACTSACPRPTAGRATCWTSRRSTAPSRSDRARRSR